MRHLALLALACCLAAAEAQPVNLDPNKPADAVQIIDVLTQQLELPRAQAVALTVAIETLRRAVAGPAPAMPAPTAPPAKD